MKFSVVTAGLSCGDPVTTLSCPSFTLTVNSLFWVSFGVEGLSILDIYWNYIS